MIKLPLKIFQLPQGNNQPVLTWPCFILMWIFRRFNGLILPITYLYFHNCPLNWKSACSTIIWCLHWNQWWFRAKTCRPASQSFHGIMRVMREPWWEPLKLSCSQVLVYRQEGYLHTKGWGQSEELCKNYIHLAVVCLFPGFCETVTHTVCFYLAESLLLFAEHVSTGMRTVSDT